MATAPASDCHIRGLISTGTNSPVSASPMYSMQASPCQSNSSSGSRTADSSPGTARLAVRTPRADVRGAPDLAVLEDRERVAPVVQRADYTLLADRDGLLDGRVVTHLGAERVAVR